MPCSTCCGKVVLVAESLRYTKVTKLQHPVLGHEYVLCFQVSVKYALLVKVLEGEGDLNKVVSHRILKSLYITQVYILGGH